MTDNEIFGYIDHTLLRATSTWEEIKKLCEEALEYKTASVCIPPSFVKTSKTIFPDLNVCTVIGFPLGYNTTEIKVAEARISLAEGADELDMVINQGDVKSKAFDKIEAEISALKKEAANKILKVIIETCYLTEEEKIKLCEIVTRSGADYIKTSTGFGTGGALLSDIEIFKKHIGKNVKMKAAGGVKTREDLVNFIEAGCMRIGTSSAVSILTMGAQANTY